MRPHHPVKRLLGLGSRVCEGEGWKRVSGSSLGLAQRSHKAAEMRTIGSVVQVEAGAAENHVCADGEEHRLDCHPRVPPFARERLGAVARLLGMGLLVGPLSLSLTHTHTHTHTRCFRQW